MKLFIEILYFHYLTFLECSKSQADRVLADMIAKAFEIRGRGQNSRDSVEQLKGIVSE